MLKTANNNKAAKEQTKPPPKAEKKHHVKQNTLASINAVQWLGLMPQLFTPSLCVLEVLLDLLCPLLRCELHRPSQTVDHPRRAKIKAPR